MGLGDAPEQGSGLSSRSFPLRPENCHLGIFTYPRLALIRAPTTPDDDCLFLPHQRPQSELLPSSVFRNLICNTEFLSIKVVMKGLSQNAIATTANKLHRVVDRKRGGEVVISIANDELEFERASVGMRRRCSCQPLPLLTSSHPRVLR